MFITDLSVNGFKNLKNIEIKPHEKINIFCGKNAQGKTNLIEAIWLCSGARSFRSTKDRRMIGDDEQVMEINLSFKNSFREQDIRYAMAKPNIKEKSVSLNGVKLKAPSKLFGGLNCVIFTPEDLELSKGSPDNRRQFADLSVSQIKNSYSAVTEKYEKLIDQRNTLLKNISYGRSRREELEMWDIQLAQMGAYISLLRFNYTRKLCSIAKKLYSEISGGSEELDIDYYSTVYDTKLLGAASVYTGELTEQYLNVLKKNIDDDIRAGFTQKGVHRDDLICKINGSPVREDASQGQHRSVALIMKLSQAYILHEEIDDHPVILLDDVLSELDPSRQKFVISKIHDMQVFITCCDMNIPFDEKQHGKIFNIEKGQIKKK
ncbi:MAG: DNA replication/repair protein RecF [Ruminococcus sp.]|uniref:DNA replication and repair protein RecF n=1 Tax=Ruminococcus albus TaxID=1264 RepID=A0A1I1N789_RUMAL|nr:MULTISPECIES: DNA replication/repair protein RecF [Ruminococcus]MBO4865061.1 DNA replication/repair protein RecF [Ruminococcus sp.]SFC91338.1 DNA replication and repair protein RecF [Ruminococcus albus]